MFAKLEFNQLQTFSLYVSIRDIRQKHDASSFTLKFDLQLKFQKFPEFKSGSASVLDVIKMPSLAPENVTIPRYLFFLIW